MKKILLLFLTVVLCSNIDAQTVTIGTGTATNTTTSYPAPYGNYWWGSRQQQMYTASELLAAGITPGSTITALGFNVITPNNTPLTGFEMQIGGSTATDLSAAWQTGLVNCFGPTNYTPTTGVNTHTLSTPYVWNGSDNLVLETCFNNAAFTNNDITEMTAVGAPLTRHYRADAAGVCANTGLTSTYTDRTNLYITYTPGGGCILPTNLMASNLTPFSAVVSWTDLNSPSAISFDIELVLATAPPSGVPTHPGVTNPDTLTGLMPGTSYDYYVRAFCSPTDSTIWAGPFTFTTPPTCFAPTALTATNITSTSADLGWTENNSATMWDLEIGLTGFAPTGSATPGFGAIGTNPFVFPPNSLPSNTCFDYYVRSICGPGDTSAWTGPYTFCTAVAALNCPPGASPSVIFQESFDNTFTGQTNLPNAAAPGWTANFITGNPTWALESNATGSGSTGPNQGAPGGGNNGYAYLEVSCVNGGNDTMISPSIDLSGVVGDARVKWFNHMYGPNSGKLDVFVDNGTSLTLIYSDSGQTQASSAAPWDSVVASLTAFVGQSIQLKFVGTAANPGGCSGDRGIDEITVEGCVACSAPTSLAASNITGTTADISWSQAGTPLNWHLEVVPTGTPPTGIPTDTATTNPFTLTGLTLYQAVDVYIRANCDTSGFSSWAGPLYILPCAPLAGTYTVDPGAPASATNFQTLNDVAFALQCGISAPVIFDMAPSTVFNEQVEFPEVMGTSATNTITFNGNGDTVTFATTASNYAVIRLNGSDYFRFNDLTILSTSLSTAIPMHIYLGTAPANHNMFTNCTFGVPVASTNFDACPFGVSGSLTSPNATPNLRADSNIIDSCTFIGGGNYALAMWGQTATPPNSTGNQVLNSDFIDFNLYGLYHANQDNFLLSNCTFSHPTRTSFFDGFPIYGSGTGNNNVYEKNHLHNLLDPSAANFFYGFYFFMDASSPASSNVIKNNLIEDVDGSGNHAGIYLPTANNMQVYNNTIVFDNVAATTTNWTRGIWQDGTGATGQDFQNNNIYITRGGTGTNHGIWLDATTPNCDYNNCWVNSLLGTNYFGENNGNHVDLAAWQASSPTVGANSFELDPIFVQPAPDYSPANAGLNNVGATGLGVVMDFTGAPRGPIPDIGAFEFNVAPTDISISAILTPDTNVGCYTANDTVVVQLTNSGSTAHDFSTNAATVSVLVNGPGGPSVLTASVTSGTLPVLGTLSVTMSPTVNLTANGLYTMDANVSTVGDANLSNDTLPTYNYNVNVVAGTLAASPDVICASGTTDLMLTGNAGGTIQWQSSPNGMAPWTNIGTGTNPYTTSVLTSTTYFRAMLTCNSNSDSSNVDTVVVNNPTIGTAINDTICGADTVTLVAIPTDTSNIVLWYDAPTGGLPLASSTDTFSAYITGTDTFYAAAVAGGVGTPILITEVCQFTTAAYVNPGPPYPANLDDPIELTNISPSPVDLSGWKIEVTGGAAGSYTIPAGNILAPGAAIVLDRGPGAADIPGVYLNTSLFSTSSSVANGYILSDALGNVMDVTATNSYNVVGTGTPVATAADWTGTTGSSGGTGGIRRTNVDDTNDGSDWTIATGANTTNYGLPNVAFTPGGGCEGTRTAVIGVSTPGPTIVASATDTLVCVGDSTQLLASGAGVGGSYVWNNGGMTGVNFVPPSSPITYTLTGTDSAGCSSVDSVTLTLATPFGDTAIASPDQHCISGTSSISVSGGGFIQWQEATSPTGPWNNVGTNSGTYNTGTLTANMYYRALSTCGATTDTSVADTVVVDNPMIASTMGDTICGPNVAVLSASLMPGSGSTINWYSSMTGGSPLDTGSTFITPFISATDTFYAVGAAGSGAPTSLATTPPGGTNSCGGGTMFDITPTTNISLDSIYGRTTGATNGQVVNIYYRIGGHQGFETNAAAWTLHATVNSTTAPGISMLNVPFGTPLQLNAGTTYGIYLNYASGYTTGAIPGTNYTNADMDVYMGTGLCGQFASTNFPRYHEGDIFYRAGCEGDPRTPVIAVVNPSPGNLALATTSNVLSTPGADSLNDMHTDGAMLSYYNPTCELIATIDDTLGGNALGMVTSKVNVDLTVNVVNGQPYARRWYEIIPTSNGPANVTLYFTQADFDDYNAHPNVIASLWDSLPSTPTSSTAFVRITKLAGGGIGVGTASVITPTSVIWNAARTHWEVTFPVDSFSQFFIHAGQNVNNPLAVKLTQFNVTKQGSVSFAAWVTAQEENNSHFNLQRSLDGNTFTTLGRVNTKAVNGNSTTELNYDFTDEAPQIGHNYYRLEQVDQNGNKSYSRVVDLVWGADGSVVAIYPNPATDILNIDLSSDKASQTEIKLLDMSGRVVKSVVAKTVKGMNHITLELDEVATGVYGVQIYENDKLMHVGKVRKN